ncbi:class I SAM-dependent methyltransferase [Sporosarcina sp. BI001-red]|uniref:class I SAM-dependent methyltransferase n=1 Tax=Sporosarcina sp. BI001-red TaxID=2282866 RepID=UPI000E21D381|nr:class I SAM-dependent methyltransferase [Sporosarcina sp. BI001-red]REB05242.1 class I SAM-dependent methyltransferase [Sporosarcina sp. BI001-red]
MNKWQQRFKQPDYVFGKEANVFIQEAVERFKIGPNVLAVAEGEGRNAVFLAEQGCNVTIWDFAQSGLDKAQALAKEKDVQLKTKVQDLQEADWPNDEYDAVICVFGHFNPELRKQTLEGIRQAVKPGGLFVIEVYAKEQIDYNTGGPKDVTYLYEMEDFGVFADWEHLHFEKKQVVRKEGEGHNGLSQVIQFVGRKK